jgi:hypothetical protein
VGVCSVNDRLKYDDCREGSLVYLSGMVINRARCGVPAQPRTPEWRAAVLAQGSECLVRARGFSTYCAQHTRTPGAPRSTEDYLDDLNSYCVSDDFCGYSICAFNHILQLKIVAQCLPVLRRVFRSMTREQKSVVESLLRVILDDCSSWYFVSILYVV